MSLADFVPVEVGEGIPPRLIVSVWGREKSGKTDFALSAPEPIYLLNFDRGEAGPIRRHRGKDIRKRDYRSKLLGSTIEAQEEVYTKFLADVKDIAFNLDGGTVVLDTGSHLKQLIQSIYIQKIRQTKEKVHTFDYAVANLHFSEIVETLKDNPYINIILIHKSSEIYSATGQRTGTYDADQMSKVPFLVDLVLRTEKGEDGGYQAVIESSRFQSSIPGFQVEGMVINDPTWDTVNALLV